MVEFQIAKNNRLKVYRQTIKQETTKGGGASAIDDHSYPSSSKSVALTTEAKPKLLLLGPMRVDKKNCDKDISNDDNNNNSGGKADEMKPKLLLLGPVRVDKKNCDKDVDCDHNNVVKTDSSSADTIDTLPTLNCVGTEATADIDGVSVGATVDVESTVHSGIDSRYTADVSEAIQQPADSCTAQRGRKAGKKSATAAAAGKGDQSATCLCVDV